MNILPSSIVTGLLLLTAITTNAALHITDSDVSDAKYSYTLAYSDLLATASDPSQPIHAERIGKFYDDVFSNTNFVVRNEGSQRYLNSERGDYDAEFIYRFDFTGTSFRAENVTISDRLTLFTSASNGARIVVDYRVNGGEWITLQTVAKPDSAVADIQKYGANAWTISFDSKVSVFEYRVRAIGNKAQNFSDQWGRSNKGQTPFAISFNLTQAPLL